VKIAQKIQSCKRKRHVLARLGETLRADDKKIGVIEPVDEAATEKQIKQMKSGFQKYRIPLLATAVLSAMMVKPDYVAAVLSAMVVKPDYIAAVLHPLYACVFS